MQIMFVKHHPCISAVPAAELQFDAVGEEISVSQVTLAVYAQTTSESLQSLDKRTNITPLLLLLSLCLLCSHDFHSH